MVEKHVKCVTFPQKYVTTIIEEIAVLRRALENSDLSKLG